MKAEVFFELFEHFVDDGAVFGPFDDAHHACGNVASDVGITSTGIWSLFVDRADIVFNDRRCLPVRHPR